jgi:hypothetical protein
VRKVIWLLAIICILLAISCDIRAARAKNIIIYENDGNREEIVLENQYLELRFFPETTEIVLTNKLTGSKWRSCPAADENPSDIATDTVTRYLMQSVFALEYADVTGVGQTLYSSEQSVNLNAYNYGIVDGALEINYTVGNLERTYVIPPAIPEEKMLPFFEKMDPGDLSIIKTGYRLYDINNLRSNDNRAELLANYPDLARIKVYVLRPEIHEYQRAEFETIFENAGYTYDDYLADIAHYPSVGGRERPAFNLTFRYSLEGNALVLNIPFDKIAYRTAYPLVRLTVLPFFGAGGLNDKGYLMVPDGSGALIYFNNGRYNQLSYTNFVYGWDEALKRTAIINDNKAPFPVFGIEKNGEAFLCIIDEGESYASVRADVSGRNSAWNNVHPRFTMVHSELMNISGRSDRSVYQYERGLPEGESINLRYILCGEDGYVGMAKEYRAWLLNKYPSLKNRNDSVVPIAVEIPGAVNKTQHRLGIPFDLPLKLTSYAEAAGMVEDFVSFGWKNVQIKLNGWFNRSVDHTIPNNVKLIKELGGKKDFEKLTDAVRRSGYTLYPEVDFFYMRDKRPFDGFSLYSDTSRYLSRERIQRYPFSFVWFGERTQWGKINYIARPAVTMSMIDNFSPNAGSFGLGNIAFRNMGATLAGDYNERRFVSREASMKMRQEKFDALKKSAVNLMFLTGHAYAMPWADFIVDIPLDDQGFGITDVPVPFYQIAIHGLVPYTGKAINLAEDYTKHFLKTVESGAGLYFSFITEETAVLQETKFRQFYANEYHKWVRDADALYRRFAADFGHLFNQAITDHVILSPGVTVTSYEDGTRVIVNASDTGVSYVNRNINANSYMVLKQGDQ